MTRPATVLGAILAALLLVGCGSGGRPAAGGPSRSSAPSASASTGVCPMLETVPEVRVGRPAYAVLYGHRQTLAAGAGLPTVVAGSLVGTTRPSVSLDGGAGTLTPAQRRTLDEVVPGSLAPLPASRDLRPPRITNQTRRPATYAVYAGAQVWHGTWSQRLCLDPARGVQTVHGRFTSTGPLTDGLAPCLRVGDLTIPALLAVREVCPASGRMFG